MRILYAILLMLSVMLSSFIFWVGNVASELITSGEKSEQILVFIDSKAKSEAAQKAKELLTTIPGFKEAQIQTPTEALKEFSEVFPEYAAGLISDESLVEEIPLVLTASFQPGILKSLGPTALDPIKSVAGFLSWQTSEPWNKTLNTVRNYIFSGASVFSILLLLIVFCLTFLLIYRIVAADKERLEIMSLCGASPRQIYLILIKKLFAPTILAIVAGLTTTYLMAFLLHWKTIRLDGLQYFAQLMIPPSLLQIGLLALSYFIVFSIVLLVSVRFSALGAYYDE